MTDWIEKDNSLHKTYEFKDFSAAMGWMQRAAVVIDSHDHHPEWTNLYNQVKVVLSTHDKGNTVTEKDRRLAAALDQL